MKKTLLSTLLLSIFSVMSYSAVVNDSIFVLKVDFEQGVLPDGWTQEYVDSDIYGEHPWVIEKAAEADYPKSIPDNKEYILALRNNSKSTIGYTTRLISPVMDLSMDKVFQPILVFSHAQQQRTGDFDQLKVFYRTGDDPKWVRLDGRNGNPEFNQKIANWKSDTISLTSQNEKYQIMFEVTDNFGRGVVLDNIEVRPMPTCVDPNGFMLNSLTTTSATISWNASFDTDSFEVALTTVALSDTVEVDPADVVWSGFLSDDEFAFSTDSLHLTLKRNQHYFLYVRAYCQGATSEWGSFKFQTKNDVKLPLEQHFTNGVDFNYKTGQVSSLEYWTCGTSIKQDDGVTMQKLPYVNTSTEPGTATAGYYAYDQNFCLAFVGKPNSISSNIPEGQYIYAATPEINIESLKGVFVSFWGTADQAVGADYAGGIIVGVMTDPEDFSTFVAIDTCYIKESRTFNKFGVSLASYQGTGKYIAFASDFRDKANRFYLDEIIIRESEAPLWPSDIKLSNISANGFDISLNSFGNAYNIIVAKHVSDSLGYVLMDPTKIADSDIVARINNQTAQTTHVTLDPTAISGVTLEVYAQCVNGSLVGDWALPVTTYIPLYLTAQSLPYKIDWEETANTHTERELHQFGSAGTSTNWPQGIISITQYAPNGYGQNQSYPYISQVSSSTTGYQNQTMEHTATAHYLWLRKEYNEVTKGDPEYYGFRHKYGNYIVLPQVEDLSKVLLKFYMQRYSSSEPNSARVAVGMVSDPYDISTFDTIAIYETNSPTEYQPFTCMFDTYKGNGKLIAIVAMDAENPVSGGSSSGGSYAWKSWYASEQRIDWIQLFPLGECNPVAGLKAEVTHDSLALSWGANGMKQWIVRLKDANGALLDSVKIDTTVYSKAGLNPHSKYTYMVSPVCDSLFEMSDWQTVETECVPQTAIPYIEDFEQYKGMDISNTNNRYRQMPFCWGYPTYSYLPSGGSSDVKPNYYPYITGSTSSAHKGSCAFGFCSSSASSSAGDVWVSFPILADSINKLQIDFWTKGNGLTYDDQLYVGTMTDGDDPTTFVAFDSLRLTGNQWQEHIKKLDSYKGISAGHHIAILLPKCSHYYYIDDIIIDNIVDCEKVFRLTTSAPKINGATFSWDKTNADKYEVLVASKAIENPDVEIPTADQIALFETDTTVVVYTNDDLKLNTSYYVYVRSICGSTKMPWSEMASFKTTCMPQTAEEYGMITFLGTNPIGCWSTGMVNGATASNLPKVNGSATSKFGYYLNFYNATTTDGAYAIMPPLDVDDINKYQISFDICHNSTVKTNVARMTVGIISNAADLSTFAPITVVKDVPYATDSLGYMRVTIPFDSYEGDYVTGAKGNQVMFLSESGDSTNYAYIDNIQFELIASCATPSTVVADSVGTYGAKICWNKTGAAYELAITSTKVAPNDAKAQVVKELKNIKDTFAVVDGLEMLTQYFMYVRTVCGAGDTSYWSNARSFTTICPDSYPMPFTEDFEKSPGTGAANKPDCWTYYYVNGATVTEGKSATYPSIVAASYSHNSKYSMQMWSSNATTKIYSYAATPYIDTKVDKAMISFWYRANAWASTTPTRKLVVGVAEEVSTLDTLLATFTVLDTIVQTNTSSTIPYEKYSRVISEKYVGDAHYVVIYSIEGNGTTSTGGMYVDDIELSLVPTCFVPDNLKADKMFDTSAELSWEQLQGDNKAWDVAYGLAGDSLKNMTIVPADTNLLVINGLKPSTAYDFYVRANCGDGDLSDWRGPVTASTLYQVALADAKWTFDNEPTKPYIPGQTNKAPESWYVNNFVTGVATTANVPYIQANSYNATTNILQSKYAHSGDSTMRLYGPGAYIALPIIEGANYDELQVRFWASDIFIYPYRKAGEDQGKDSVYYTTYSYKSATQATSSYKRTIRVGVAADPYDMSTFEELTPYILPIVGTATSTKAADAVDPEGTSWWREVVVPLYGAKGKYIIFAAPEEGSNVVYFDDVVVEKVDPNACANVTKLAMDEEALKYNAAEFNWLSPKSSFKVTITESEKTEAYATAIVDTAYFKIDTLQPQTTYTISVQAVCGDDLSKAVTLDFTTPCKPADQAEASWTFTENLYQFGTTATYVIPECWDNGLGFGSGQSYTPYAIANPKAAAAAKCYARTDTVNARALQFYTTKSYYNAYAVLPELSFPVDSMTLHFWGRAAQFNSKNATTASNKNKLSAKNDAYARALVVGVIEDASDFATFTPIDTITYDYVWTATTAKTTDDKSGNDYWQEYALPLAKYAGKGRITIVAPNPADFSTASTPTSYFFVDDLEIVEGDFCTPVTGQRAENVTATSATIRWSGLLENNIVEIKVATGKQLEAATVIYHDTLTDVNSVALKDLKPATAYYFALKHLCDTTLGDESDWSSISSFTTDYVVRFSENFNEVQTTIPANWWRSNSATAEEVFSGEKELSEASATASYDWRTNSGENQYIFANLTTNNASSTASSSKHWLITPQIDLSANEKDSLLLSFDIALRSSAGNVPNVNEGVLEQFMVIVSTDEGATWKQENATIWSTDIDGEFNFNNFYANGKFLSKYIDMSKYAGQTVCFAFYISSYADKQISGSKNIVLLDNIQLNTFRLIQNSDNICRWEDYSGYGFNIDADLLPAGENKFESFTRADKDGEKDIINRLSVNVTDESINTLDTVTLCEGDNYNEFNFSFIANESMVYKQKLQNFAGCDSTVILPVLVNKKIYVDIVETICQGAYYEFNGVKYYTSINHTDTLQSALTGCDSIVTLHLTVNEILKGETEIIDRCPTDSAYYFTEKYPALTEDGIYTDTILTAKGCDSIAAIQIVNHEEAYTFFRAAICQGEKYDEGIFGGLTKPGEYSTPHGEQGLKTVYGCDSIVTLHLLVATPTEEQTYVLEDSIAIDKLPYVLNGQEFLPVGTEEGVYTRTITLNCGEATLLIKVGNPQGINNTFVNSMAVSPNPAQVGQPVQVLGSFDNAAVEVISATGAVVYSAQNLNNPIVIPGMPAAGVYLIRLTEQGKVYQTKLMVK